MLGAVVVWSVISSTKRIQVPNREVDKECLRWKYLSNA